jgi:hypothetical protein
MLGKLKALGLLNKSDFVFSKLLKALKLKIVQYLQEYSSLFRMEFLKKMLHYDCCNLNCNNHNATK